MFILTAGFSRVFHESQKYWSEQAAEKLDEAPRALSELNSTIAELNYNPKDHSVAGAIVEMERSVDANLAPCRGNSIIGPLATKSKETFRKAIEACAAAARA